MDSVSIRRAFLDFFAERDHTIVPSYSLIPADPMLLFTSAGMVQFKSYLAGEEPPPYPRAASVQKCFRTVDIDTVGTTTHHFTFFEMLGNFSFGDYFKERAIPWAYEFVTEQLRLDPDRLWFTVHDNDDEAAEIWIDTVGIAPDRVQRAGDEENFWQMGVPGPAGPDSELFYDRGPEHGEGGGPIGGSEDRFVEFWNLVFMQHVQDEPFHVIGDLPARNIDTGAGLDRLAMLLQDAPSAFENDMNRAIMAAGERATGTNLGESEETDRSLRIFADHGRALTFLIGDGVTPTNEGRGYVLRRIMRRAVRHAWSLGAEQPVTPALADATIDVMRDAYPDLAERRDLIVDVAEREEFNFRRTLESGFNQLISELDSLDQGTDLDGNTAFRLHDTFGFPVELTEEISAERGHGLDRPGFDTLMEEQRQRARAAWTGAAAAEEAEAYRGLLDEIGPTDFVGYEISSGQARILSIVRDGEAIERAEEGQEVEVFLDRTPFYAESGGQVGDSGFIRTETGGLTVIDTVFPLTGLHGHRATVSKGFVQVGQDASTSIDSERRERIAKSHTGTHIVHWALREVLGAHVQQAGSLVEAGRLRFDFSHHSAVAGDDLSKVERAANERVLDNAHVHAFETFKEEAEELGALAFFGDKYGDRVRVVEVGTFSRELCGGTHVRSAGQTGPLVITGEGSIGSNMRRIEVLTGSTAYERISALRRELESTASILRTDIDGVAAAATSLTDRAKDQEARLAAFADQERAGHASDLVETAEPHGSGRLVVAAVPGLSPDDLRALTMQVRDRLGDGIVVLGSQVDGKGNLVATVSDGLVSAGISAGELIADAARALGGGGSRDPALSQAGGPEGGEIEQALDLARAAARHALEAG